MARQCLSLGFLIVFVVQPLLQAQPPTPGGLLDILRQQDEAFFKDAVIRCDLRQGIHPGFSQEGVRQAYHVGVGHADGVWAQESVLSDAMPAPRYDDYTRQVAEANAPPPRKLRDQAARLFGFGKPQKVDLMRRGVIATRAQEGELREYQRFDMYDVDTSEAGRQLKCKSPHVEFADARHPFESFHVMTPALCSGRGYSYLIDAVQGVSEIAGGLLKVVATGVYPPSTAPSLEIRLVLEPQAGWLVRKAEFAYSGKDEKVIAAFETEETQRFDDRTLARKATFVNHFVEEAKTNPDRADRVEFTGYEPGVASALVEKVLKTLEPPYSRGTSVRDTRQDRHVSYIAGITEPR